MRSVVEYAEYITQTTREIIYSIKITPTVIRIYGTVVNALRLNNAVADNTTTLKGTLIREHDLLGDTRDTTKLAGTLDKTKNLKGEV